MNAPAGIAAIFLACLVIGAGCTSAPPVENLTAPEIAGRYMQAQENVQDFSATVESRAPPGWLWTGCRSKRRHRTIPGSSS